MVESTFEPHQRLHPMSWLFGIVAFVRQFIVPIVVAAVFGSRGNGPSSWIVYVFVPLLAAAVWKQIFYRYGFGPGGLVIREGLFFHNLRQIDYSRIENIDTERGILHRLLGVAEVRVETSTGGKPEALIQVLGLEAAEELRRRVFESRGEVRETAQESEERLLHLPVPEVVKFGLIDNRGMIVVAGLFGLLYESGAIEVWTAIVRSRLSEQMLDEVIALGPVLQAALATGLLIAVLALVRAFSVVLALVTIYDFTLARAGDDLRARYGLLTRIALTLRVRRIQAAHVTDTLLHRFFKRVSVRVDLAGDGVPAQQGQDAAQKVRWLAPLVEPNRARELMARALPDIDFNASVQWQPLAPGARRRVFRRSLAWWIFISIALAAMSRSFAPLLLVAIAVPISMLYAEKYVHYTRWALQPDALFFRYGWLTRKMIVVPRNRVQTVRLTVSPFDRRHAMATVSVDTAGAGPRSDPVRIPYLEQHVARELGAALYESSALESERELQALPRAVQA